MRFEPALKGLEVPCSIQLSYERPWRIEPSESDRTPTGLSRGLRVGAEDDGAFAQARLYLLTIS
jgi:hypothetical protein